MSNFLNSEDFSKELSKVIYNPINPKLIITVGCGGSHSLASHFTAELIGTYIDRKRIPYPSLTMFADQSTSSAISNDFSFEDVPRRFLKSFEKIPSILVAFTTSGKSPVIVNSLKSAKENNMQTFLLTGSNKAVPSIKYSDYVFTSPFETVSKVQENHLCMIHLICERLEQK